VGNWAGEGKFGAGLGGDSAEKEVRDDPALLVRGEDVRVDQPRPSPDNRPSDVSSSAMLGFRRVLDETIP
jgi:hypothetical protein